jgi:hypothetical protein
MLAQKSATMQGEIDTLRKQVDALRIRKPKAASAP